MSKRHASLLAAAVALATTALVGGGTAAASDTPCADAPNTPVTNGAVFSNPVAGEPTAIVEHICGLVHQTPAGARIRVAEFVMSGAAGGDFASELIKAHRRGVNVQVVVDGDKRGATVAGLLAAELGTDITAPSWIHVCTGPPSGGTAACIGNKGQHSKYYLFSRTGGATDVVVQSSANVTDLNSSTYWNDEVTLIGNTRLYEAYNHYFDDQAAERKNLDYYRVVTTGDAGGSVRAYFFPRAGTDATTDTIVEELNKVRCTPGTTIRAGNSEWDAYRIAVPERLRELAAQGCKVQVVYGIMDDEDKQVLLGDPSIDLRELGNGDALPGRLHSKYLLIEGSFDGESDAHVVFTGSHNYNQTSLRRNDEAMLRLNNRAIYDQYVSTFQKMQAAAAPVSAP